MRDASGQWLDSVYDAAIMCPVMEMAGFEKVRYNDRVLYIYNADNPLSFHNIDRRGQLQDYQQIMKKKPFLKIPSYL